MLSCLGVKGRNLHGAICDGGKSHVRLLIAFVEKKKKKEKR